MKFVLITRSREQAKSITFSLKQAVVWAFFLLLSLISISFYFGAEHGGRSSLQEAIRSYLARMEQDLEVLKKAVTELESTQDLQLYAYSVRVARLQAQLTELNALGQEISDQENFVHGKELAFSDSSNVAMTVDSDGRPSGRFRNESFDSIMDGIERELEHKGAQMKVLQTLVNSKEATEGFRISGYPVNGIRWVSSRFGYRIHPIYKTRRFHAGLDIATPQGNKIFSTANGIVTYAGYMRGYGNVVDVDHGGGVMTRYAHLLKVIAVKGQIVSKGDTLGLAGSTGVSTGSHLHYEVRINGKPVDPYSFVFRK